MDWLICCRAPARQGSPVEASLGVRFDHDHRDQNQDGAPTLLGRVSHQMTKDGRFTNLALSFHAGGRARREVELALALGRGRVLS